MGLYPTILAIGFVLNLIFATACALLARNKNRYTAGWFVFGFFFGLVALIIILLVREPKIKRQPFYFEPKPLIPKPISNKYLAQSGLIASLYAVLTVILAPISYGPIQVRVSEILTVLPFVTPAAVPGLFIGCMVANIYGGLGVYDIFGGSLCTLFAAILTQLLSRIRIQLSAPLVPLPPVVINSLGVSLYLHLLFRLPYWITVSYIAIGEFVACYILGGILLIIVFWKTNFLNLLRV